MGQKGTIRLRNHLLWTTLVIPVGKDLLATLFPCPKPTLSGRALLPGSRLATTTIEKGRDDCLTVCWLSVTWAPYPRGGGCAVVVRSTVSSYSLILRGSLLL